MKQGFYDGHILKGLFLIIFNTSMNTYDVYRVRKNSVTYLNTTDLNSVLWKKATFIMPFDHIPSVEELQQYPELFI